MPSLHRAVCVKHVLIECKVSAFHFCLDNTVNFSKHGWEKRDCCIKTMPYKQLQSIYQFKKILANITLKKKHEYKENNLSNARLHLPFSALFVSEVVVVLHDDVVCSQNTVHLLPLFFTGGGHSTALMASSNTVFRPRWVSAEHSRYFTAPGERKKKKKTSMLLLVLKRKDSLSNSI